MSYKFIEEKINNNRDKIAERLCKIISYKFQEDNIDQTPLEPEQMIFSLKPSPEEKSLMDRYVWSNQEEQFKIHKNYLL